MCDTYLKLRVRFILVPTKFGIPFSRDGLNVKIFTYHHHHHHRHSVKFKGKNNNKDNKKNLQFCKQLNIQTRHKTILCMR